MQGGVPGWDRALRISVVVLGPSARVPHADVQLVFAELAAQTKITVIPTAVQFDLTAALPACALLAEAHTVGQSPWGDNCPALTTNHLRQKPALASSQRLFHYVSFREGAP
ncbi:MAG: hypothetical protein A3G02_02920 [Candidatus Yanofskybacteria bacterium RIFCSPLOWO2_12_FULL_44_13b]|uniref:Uncharacterized protein n=1 Tax=Candidatus Yanofskybacteria bacterium RIFCSPLOWO2_02_FULL_44_18 TaxID=1802705 RepID=A0A1F8H1W2_9BACT|nr:MAG: hypothetical protein A3C01_02170 [Candidatus Yanofskybacteria bacterium RIFCSPHIGHO2_02_FULL_44_36b]OGN18321.1 MAG: hypothetical protein A3F50_00230 [Candidatus Yanofskybacteria bacterium RIFCSPHIGHO2_12_FULL_44_29b]OGN30898.1 MAG: hypothetical protein A3I96_01285 [Candidatus Yanofskybacteria bacterium RIFCSPLOWO2_02_FULL_44_18]OGN34690.1 MAG: hypothetical protein A3G02_02920 [Candidatus Yanofskybacteria bacterium RIFCSPLOWO2_12_FULL_44_13b]